MDNRKWAANAIINPPAPPAAPSDGYPTNGDPLAPVLATKPGDYWFHAIGEELRAIITEGGLVPNIGTLTQVRDAIRNMIKGGDYKPSVRVASTVAINLAAPGANIDGVAMVLGDRFLEKNHATLASRGIYIWNGAAVPATRASDADDGAEFNGGATIPVEQGTLNADTNWQITNDGVVIIGVTGLTFQQQDSQNFASDAEAQAFTLANKSIAPLTLANAFKGGNQSLATNGYQILPGGLIIQWGNPTAGATSGTVTFPIAFPNQCLFRIAKNTNEGVAAAGAENIEVATYDAMNVTNFKWAGTNINTGILASPSAFSWIAIGF